MLTEDELDGVLEDDGAENAPLAIPGASPGTRPPPTTSEEAEARRAVVGTMLHDGHSVDRIARACAKAYGLDREGVMYLIREVRAQWAEEDKEGAKWRRAEAVRRIKANIRKAVAVNQHAAAAQYEKTLMEVEGTSAELAAEGAGVEGGAHADAVMQLLAELRQDDPREFRMVIERERARERVFIERGPDPRALPEPVEATVVER